MVDKENKKMDFRDHGVSLMTTRSNATLGIKIATGCEKTLFRPLSNP